MIIKGCPKLELSSRFGSDSAAPTASSATAIKRDSSLRSNPTFLAMSYPYVHNPYSYPDVSPYVDTFFTQTEPSPFIPDATLYPPSPYTSAPNTPRRVRFGNLPDEYVRVRRPSWHGDPPVVPVPFPQTSSSPYLAQPDLPSHQRRHSFGASHPPPWYSPFNPNQYTPWPYQSNQLLLHPLLNGEAPRPDFHFDLSSAKFSPVIWTGPGHTSLLPPDQYAQPATHPGMTRMRIVCDRIPNWPIDIGFSSSLPSPSVPITLGDVLVMVHRVLHTRISHLEWARLSTEEETLVARAYTKRCKSIPSTTHFEMSQGVKRIDFLLDKVVFRGLLRTSTKSDGVDVFKLVLKSSS